MITYYRGVYNYLTDNIRFVKIEPGVLSPTDSPIYDDDFIKIFITSTVKNEMSYNDIVSETKDAWPSLFNHGFIKYGENKDTPDIIDLKRDDVAIGMYNANDGITFEYIQQGGRKRLKGGRLVYNYNGLRIYLDQPIFDLLTVDDIIYYINDSFNDFGLFDKDEIKVGGINDGRDLDGDFIGPGYHLARGEQKDMVHNPSHYRLEDGTEVKMHILALLGKEGFINYAKGNIIKYTARLGKKDNMDQELGKIQEYAQMIRDVIAD